jgi:hypothetical protein
LRANVRLRSTQGTVFLDELKTTRLMEITDLTECEKPSPPAKRERFRDARSAA